MIKTVTTISVYKKIIKKMMMVFLGMVVFLGMAIPVIALTGNDLWDARYVQIDMPYENRIDLGNAEVVFVNMAVTQNVRGWGWARISYSLYSLQRISYSLQREAVVTEGRVDVFLSYRLWNNRSIGLFRYDFSRHGTYLLEISLNDVHVYSQLLFGR